MMDKEIAQMATGIVCAALQGPHQLGVSVPEAIVSAYDALAGCGQQAAPVEQRPEPAVSIRASVQPDYLVCLEDGKKMKMLKRYLMTQYGMTPEQYRTRWNLPADYPMVGPEYAEKRRKLAKDIGLGRKKAPA